MLNTYVSNGNCEVNNMQHNEDVIQIKNISKKIGKRLIIDNVSLSIKKGEVFGLVGANGAGKTTIMRMITGLIEPTSGEILIDNNDIKNRELALKSIGAIIEGPDLYKHLSGKTNLKIMANMYENISNNRIKEVASLLDIENRLKDKVKTYSLGMRQRLGIAVAMLNNPKILILDEPLNGLDPQGVRQMRNVFKSLAESEGVTVIISSHILGELEMVCDRFSILHNGQIVETKSIEAYDENTNKEYELKFLQETSVVKIEEILHKINIKLVSTSEYGILIYCDKYNIAKVIRELSINNIDIISVIPKIKSLEDYYVEKVGGTC